MEKKTKLLVMRFILSVPKSWKFCERSHTWERGYQLGIERFTYRSDEIKFDCRVMKITIRFPTIAVSNFALQNPSNVQ